MKKCPFCAEDIQDAAVVCKHCGRDLAAVPLAPAAAPTRKTSNAAWLALGFFVFVGIAWCSTISRPPSSPATTARHAAAAAAAAKPQFELVLLSSRGYRTDGGGYFIVEGEVKNVTGDPLQRVTAVSSWYSKADVFITSDAGAVEFDPILPGQTSPFKTMSRYNPEMSKYSVQFKARFGRVLSTDDQRKVK